MYMYIYEGISETAQTWSPYNGEYTSLVVNNLALQVSIYTRITNGIRGKKIGVPTLLRSTIAIMYSEDTLLFCSFV